MWLFDCWFVGVQTDGTWVTSWGIWVTSWGNGWTPHVKAHLSKSFMSYYTSKYLDVLMIGILIWLYQHTYIDMWQHIYQTLLHIYTVYIYIYVFYNYTCIYIYIIQIHPETNNTPQNNQTTFSPVPHFHRSRLCYGLQCGWSFSGFRSVSSESSKNFATELGGSSLDLSMQLGGEHLSNETNWPMGCFGCFLGGWKTTLCFEALLFSHDFLLFSKLNIVYSIHSPVVLTCFLLENGGPGLKMYGSYWNWGCSIQLC